MTEHFQWWSQTKFSDSRNTSCIFMTPWHFLLSVSVLAFGWWIERLVRLEPKGFLFWTEMVYWVEFFFTCWEAVNMPNFEILPLICYSIPFNLLGKKRSCICFYICAHGGDAFGAERLRKTIPNPVISSFFWHIAWMISNSLTLLYWIFNNTSRMKCINRWYNYETCLSSWHFQRTKVRKKLKEDFWV